MGLDDFKKNQEKKVIDTNKKVRVGIIGTGWIAEAHIASYLRQPDVEIVAGADLIPGKAKAFFEKHGVEGVKTDYASHKEMLADKSLNLDAVSICTYNRQHAQPAIDSLNAGINVLLEKPFTVTLDEAVEVIKAEKASGKILSIGHQPRMDANMKMIKKICQSGQLGQIYYIQTGGGRRRGIPTPYGTSFIEDKTAGLGALGDIGCYSLDMVLNAVGNPKPLTVSGYKSAFFGKDPNYSNYVKTGHPEYASIFGVDDFAAAFIRLEGGIILDFRIAWAMNLDTSGDTIIYGTGKLAYSFHRVLERLRWRRYDHLPRGMRRADPNHCADHQDGREPLRSEDPYLPRCSEGGRNGSCSFLRDPVQPGYHRRYRKIRRGRQGS